MRTLYNRSFILILVGQVCFVMANALMAHYARWIEFLGGDVRQVGWIMGLGPVVSLLVRPWLGQWIVRFGVRTMWILGYLIFSVGTLGNLLVVDIGWPVYVMRMCFILGAAIVFTGTLTYVSQSASPERQAEAIGVMGLGGFVGMLTGPYLGDVILGTGVRTRPDFTLLFIIASAAIVIPSVLLFFIRLPVARQASSSVRLIDFARTVLRHWPGTILLVNAVFGLCIAIPFGFLADFIDARGIRVPWMSELGLFFLGYAGWGLILRLSSRRLPDRIGRRRVLIVGLIAMGIGMFCFLFVNRASAWLLIVPGLVCGTGHALMFHTMTSVALEPFPIEKRGAGSALVLMMIDIGFIGGAPLLGQIAAGVGYAGVFVTVGTICLLTAVLYAISCRVGKRVVIEQYEEAIS